MGLALAAKGCHYVEFLLQTLIHLELPLSQIKNHRTPKHWLKNTAWISIFINQEFP